MLVDPEALRALASQADTGVTAISGLDVDAVATSSADGLAGSATHWVARQVGRHLGLAASDIGNDLTAMGSAVRGAGDRYEVEDVALADDFERLF